MAPLVLASELAWGDGNTDGDGDGGSESGGGGRSSGEEDDGLSPAALRPLSRMSEQEQQVKVVNKKNNGNRRQG